MSCGNCGSCGCNPCSCSCECDPANESVSSQLENFITAFFGSVTKSCVNGEVVWSLPCDLDGGIPGYPRLPNEGIACYLLRIWGTCNCSFLTLTDTPDSYAGQAGKVVTVNGTETGLVFTTNSTSDSRGFPSAQAVWLDTDAALQTPNGQPAFTTAQAAYNAADALATLSGLPVVIMVGKGAFGNINTAGADWNSNVSISGLGRGISSIDTISTLNLVVPNSASGNLDIVLHGISIVTGIATYTMDASGAFDAGNVTISGDDASSPVVYAATPAGGGNGGNVTIADRSSFYAGAILTNSDTTGKSSGSVTIGEYVHCGYISTASTGDANAGNVLIKQNAECDFGIDAFVTNANSATVTLDAGSYVGGSVIASSFSGVGGQVVMANRCRVLGNVEFKSLSGVGPTVQILGSVGGFVDGSSTNGAGATITIGDGNEPTIVGAAVASYSTNAQGGNVEIQTFCKTGNVNSNGATGGGSITLRVAAVSSVLNSVASSSGTAGAIQLDYASVCGGINAYGQNTANGGAISLGVQCAVGGDVNVSADSGNAGNVNLHHGAVINGNLNGRSNSAQSSLVGSDGSANRTVNIDISTGTGTAGQLILFEGSNIGNLNISSGNGGTRGSAELHGVDVRGTITGTADTTSRGVTINLYACNVSGNVNISGSNGAGAGETNIRRSELYSNLIATNYGSATQAGVLVEDSAITGDINIGADGVGSAGNLVLTRSTVRGNVDATGINGANGGGVQLYAGIVAFNLDISSDTGAGGGLEVLEGSFARTVIGNTNGGSAPAAFKIHQSRIESLTATANTTTVGGSVELYESSVDAGVNLAGTNGAGGGTIYAYSSSIFGNIVVSTDTGSAGTAIFYSTKTGDVNGTATTGVSAGISAYESDLGAVDVSHVGGTASGVIGRNAKFSSITANADGAATQSAGLNIENCVVTGAITTNADNGATTSNATLRSGSYGSIVFDAINASNNQQYNIFAAYVGNISGNNDGGAQAGYLTAASCKIGDVSLKGTSGSAGGFINADNCKFGIVDVSGSPISGQVGMTNCSVQDFTNSGSAGNTFNNCALGPVHTAGFLSRFFGCQFNAAFAADCVTLTSNGAVFKDCTFRTDGNCVGAAAPQTCEFYNVLTRTDKSANVTLTVADYIIRPGL